MIKERRAGAWRFAKAGVVRQSAGQHTVRTLHYVWESKGNI